MPNGPTTTRARARTDRQGRMLDAQDGGHRMPRALTRTNSQSAQRSYERYLALARAEVQIGNTVAAENYYQHAEHYFRSMRPDPDGT